MSTVQALPPWAVIRYHTAAHGGFSYFHFLYSLFREKAVENGHSVYRTAFGTGDFFFPEFYLHHNLLQRQSYHYENDNKEKKRPESPVAFLPRRRRERRIFSCLLSLCQRTAPLALRVLKIDGPYGPKGSKV